MCVLCNYFADVRRSASLLEPVRSDITDTTANVKLTFEITEAHIENKGKSKYVVSVFRSSV